MNFKLVSNPIRVVFILVSFLWFSQCTFAQNVDNPKNNYQVNGLITVTNNGISVIPTFTLGKPATIFDVFVRKNRLSFEPQLRFAIEDFKPWSFIFWMRYKLIQNEKFKMGIGAHPSTVFSNTTITNNGVTSEAITVKRYFASELTPTYIISKNLNLGIYYLYSRGIADATRNTNYAAFMVNFSNIHLSKDYSLRFSPQLYYLRMDKNVGYYASSSLSLSKQNFPISIATMANKKFKSDIPSDDLVWNVSLMYGF